MRILVGRSIQAKAASSNETRNLFKRKPKTGGGSGVETYCKIESMSLWAAFEPLAFCRGSLLLLAVQCQCQGQ
jgi:hypothetical protein